ncbi:hypothetical protein GGX14DRAFT_111086, partial [Mycena pura]
SVLCPHGASHCSRRRGIDTVVTYLDGLIAALQVERNALAPISALPDELLSKIFDGIGAFPSLQVMLVCRHWHEVALSSPALWSNLEFTWRLCPQRFLSQLQRSKTAKLTVKIECMDSSFVIPWILANANRLMVLDLAGERHHVLDAMHQMRRYDFPILRTLCLSPHAEGDSDTTAIFPSDLLDRRVPCLRKLTLCHIDAPWQSLSCLNSLTLFGSPATPPIFLHDLLSVLRACPDLRDLRLNTILDHGIIDHYGLAALPLLEHLDLREHISCCEALLGHLSFPDSTRLDLYPLGITAGDAVRSILVRVRKHLRALSAPQPTMLKLSVLQPSDSDPDPEDPDGPVCHCTIKTFLKAALPVSSAHPVLFSINSHPETARAQRQILTKVLKTFRADAIT